MDFVRGTIFKAAVLALLAIVVYVPAIRAGFVWNDDTFLTINPLVRDDQGLRLFWLSTEAPDYFPLTSTTLWIEWRRRNSEVTVGTSAS